MRTFTTADGAQIFFKDWGAGQPLVFSHGWPLSADAWDAQLLHFGRRGFRVIAHDRRGHGRSSQTWRGHEMDTYADDLALMLDLLDLQDAVLIGHSTGGGEVVRYVGRYGTQRLSGVVLIGAVPPLMMQTPANPHGIPRKVFDDLRAGVAHDRAQLFKELPFPFYGFNRPGAKVSQGLLDSYWRQAVIAGVNAVHDCIAAFSETDFTADLKRLDVPTLFIHGDDDQIVPLDASARRAVELVRDAELKVYPGAPHGLAQTVPERLNADLEAFIAESARPRAGRPGASSAAWASPMSQVSDEAFHPGAGLS